MCGISGFNWKDEEKVSEMVHALSHRGPDADGIFVDKGISLGHNRLSIIDLSLGASQPMTDNTGDLVIVYNGEIYNFLELKKELEADYDFKTKSDTEVILAGYRKWGNDIVERLNGMFAFAIWNKQDKTLFCARDQAGMKPLYYYFTGSRLIFASEIKAILTHGMPRKLNIDAFNHYFRELYVPAPMTMIENIFKLPPSHTLLLKDGILSVREYGKNFSDVTKFSYREAVSETRKKVIEAVERQLVSDVPLGVYLSGGIDSSTVLFSMSQFRKNIKTFSIGFNLTEEEGREKFNHDFELARKTAEFFGTDHHSILISAQDALESFEEMISFNDHPISNQTSLAMFLLAKFARKNVTVVLTGSGGDELMGGYDRYRMALVASYYKKLPKLLRALGSVHPQMAKLNYKSNADLFARFMFEKDFKLSRVISPAVFVDDSKIKEYFQDRYLSECSSNPAECFMQVDQKSWLPEHFFMLSDSMSMSSALEERAPLVDKELTRFINTLPRSYKLDLFNTKMVLKDAFRNDLPEYLFSQPKRGWFSPGAKWLRNPAFSEFARSTLSEGYYSGTKSLFNWPEVQNMFSRHLNMSEYNLTILWALLTFQAWARKYQIEV